MLGLIWIQSIWHSDGIPERIFRKSWFWKQSADDKKSMKNFPGGKELKLLVLPYIDSWYRPCLGAAPLLNTGYDLGLWDHTALSYELNKQQQPHYFGRSRVNIGESSKFPKSRTFEIKNLLCPVGL